jgi:hypothetical protein
MYCFIHGDKTCAKSWALLVGLVTMAGVGLHSQHMVPQEYVAKPQRRGWIFFSFPISRKRHGLVSLLCTVLVLLLRYRTCHPTGHVVRSKSGGHTYMREADMQQSSDRSAHEE